jgi:hypothetical protein
MMGTSASVTTETPRADPEDSGRIVPALGTDPWGSVIGVRVSECRGSDGSGVRYYPTPRLSPAHRAAEGAAGR